MDTYLIRIPRFLYRTYEITSSRFLVELDINPIRKLVTETDPGVSEV